MITGIASMPEHVDDFHDLVIWLSAVLAALAVIVGLVWHKKSPIRRMIQFVWRRLIGEPFGTAVRGYVREAVSPEITCLSTKIDVQGAALAELTTLNSDQHAETAAKIDRQGEKIDDLQLQLAQHILANPGLPEAITGPLPVIPTRHRQGY